MQIGINEIRARAMAFTKRWAGEKHERAESQTFWNEFFDVFGVDRRRFAEYEKHVKKLDGKDGYIDAFWSGLLLVEQKSYGVPLKRAYEQARQYFPGLQDYELPKFILVSDFNRFRLDDLIQNASVEFKLDELLDHIGDFGFISGYRQYLTSEQDPVNVKAAEAMGKLHDQLKGIGYSGHALEVYMVRILFCLFADDASIFSKGQFYEYVDVYSRKDGSDLAGQIAALFQVLNTPMDKRFSNGDATLNAFPYIDGQLFEDVLPLPYFDEGMRKTLLNCCALDWGMISPAIFGAMFQSVMDPEKRRALGAHYTSEKNIMKVIKPLFLDDLYTAFEESKGSLEKLLFLRTKLGSLRFLDPACGCGNFLVLAYRELRLLEIEINKEISKRHSMLDFADKGKSIIDVDQFYGIEIEDFPAQIAKVALWLMDHQMNMLWGAEIGQYYARLPLGKKANIKVSNALTMNWAEFVSPLDLSYILGNPPFSGARVMDKDQKQDMNIIFGKTPGVGNLDYVAAWYRKSLDYIKGTNIKAGLVSTNSITQGEQVGILWKPLLEEGLKIVFAHRTFKWSNEAKNKAAVFCVIIGFSMVSTKKAQLFYYTDPKGEPISLEANRINPYLVDAEDILVESKKHPICNVPEIGSGNQPIDDGNYLFSFEEMNAFILKEPQAAKLFRPWVGSDELINGYSRYCLYLKDCSPDLINQLPSVRERVASVREFRQKSIRTSTINLAQKPTRFQVENVPTADYIAIPETSSESRHYIPIKVLPPEVLSSNAIRILPSSSLYFFGILTSAMHMAWVRAVGGRLKGDYRYSKDIIYNTFPWPESSEKQKDAIEVAANQILTVRTKYPNCSLAVLYNPNTMPPNLVDAHNHLDMLVDKAYGLLKGTELRRIAFLMDLYRRFVQ